MGNPVYGYSHKAGICQDDFFKASCRRISVIRCKQVGFNGLPDGREPVKKHLADTIALRLSLIFCHGSPFFAEIQGKVNLLIQVIENIFYRYGKTVFRIINLKCPFPEIARVDDPEQIMNNMA